jgi:hypothetical protein
MLKIVVRSLEERREEIKRINEWKNSGERTFKVKKKGEGRGEGMIIGWTHKRGSKQ